VRADGIVWTLALAIGALAFVLGLALAPALGTLIQPEPIAFWPDEALEALVRPEPTELVRFALAIAVPVATAAFLVFGRLEDRIGTQVSRVSDVIGPLLVLALIGVGWFSKSEPAVFGLPPAAFGERDLAIGLVLAGSLVAVALLAGPTSLFGRARDAVAAGAPHSRAGRMGCGAIALGATAMFLLPAVYRDEGLADAIDATLIHLPFTHADFAAFGNGLTPFADFSSQYSNLLPWGLHPFLSAFDYAPGVFTVTMAVLSGIALLAVWRSLAIVVRSEAVGVLLFLPVLALAVRPTIEIGDERVSNASLVQILPERYLLPFVVAWLCVRHLRGLWPRSVVAVFFVAGLALLNNPEFGVPCVFAAAAAVIMGGEQAGIRRVGTLVGRAALGLALATVFVTLITLLRSGSLPDPGLMTFYSRLFASQGYGLQPMPTPGFYLVPYVTFGAALVLSAVRHHGGHPDRDLTGLLAYVGLFGLGAGIYYAGRSNVLTLIAMFPAWAFAVSLLGWISFSWISSKRIHPRDVLTLTGALALSALLGFGLAASALREAPAPWQQAARLSDESELASPFDLEAEESFVESRTQAGEAILIMHENGHLLARRAGVRNVSTIGDPAHLVTGNQLDDLLGVLHSDGGDKVFVGDGQFIPIYPSVRAALRARGWAPRASDPASGLVEWTTKASGSVGFE
jgi:hypothetical protein